MPIFEFSGRPVMLAHQVTGTYLETDNYNDHLDQAVQTWNEDPLKTEPGWLGHKWCLEPNEDGTHRLESFEHRHCLTVQDTTDKRPVLKNAEYQGENILQSWILVSCEIDAETYALVSAAHRHYALGIEGHSQVNNWYVALTRMHGREPLLSQLWRVVGLEN